jgi:recombination protein RecR
MDGIGPDDLAIKGLEERCKDSNIKEVILATSLTPQGETTALYLEKILKREGLEISRIGYGIPAGGDIEYADELTLRKALSSRIKL